MHAVILKKKDPLLSLPGLEHEEGEKEEEEYKPEDEAIVSPALFQSTPILKYSLLRLNQLHNLGVFTGEC